MNPSWAPRCGGGKWKMILKEGEAQLYDLEADLIESKNVVVDHPKVAASMREAIETFKKTVVPGW